MWDFILIWFLCCAAFIFGVVTSDYFLHGRKSRSRRPRDLRQTTQQQIDGLHRSAPRGDLR